jgi:hypothetical protein
MEKTKETLADKKKAIFNEDGTKLEDYFYPAKDVRESVERLKKRFDEFDMVFKFLLVNDMIDEEFGDL